MKANSLVQYAIVMKIKSEFDLIEKIRERVSLSGMLRPGELICGIGDDAAVYKLEGDRFGIFTTDISIESVHFDMAFTGHYDIGYKSMTGNLSDIAAMGGYPVLALISMGIPAGMDEDCLLLLYDGIIDAGKKWNTVIAGGDLSASDRLVINIAIYGEAVKNRPVYRKGAGIGDRIYVTGSLGGSMAGLEILKSGDSRLLNDFSTLVNRHRRPECRLDLLDTIISKFQPSSMIDISDGLLSELGHIGRKSGRGFILFRDNIPIAENLKKYSLIQKKDPYIFAMNSGEEYELLFTSAGSPGPIDGITLIGEITGGGFMLRSGGGIEEIVTSGFDHFAEKYL